MLFWRSMASFRGANDWHENGRSCKMWIERESAIKHAAAQKSQTHSSLASKWCAIEWQIVRAFNFQRTRRHSKNFPPCSLVRRNTLRSLLFHSGLIEFQTFRICRWWARRQRERFSICKKREIFLRPIVNKSIPCLSRKELSVLGREDNEGGTRQRPFVV